MQSWLINGQPGELIAARNRGLAYGDGLFETIAVRAGGARLIERHLERLATSCARLAIPAPSANVLAGEIESLCRGCERGTIKVVITRGDGPRGYGYTDGLRPTRLVGFDADNAVVARSPARVVSCRTPSSTNSALAGMKTLNRLDSVLARAELRQSRADEGLMWDDHGHVSGGTMCNLFAVHDGRLLTPALDRGGVRGVMRGQVLDVAAHLGLETIECPIDRDLLGKAGEAFLTNALVTLWPIRSIDGHELPDGPVASALIDALDGLGISEATG